MTVSGNTDDYCMSRSSVPDVFDGLVFRVTLNQGTSSAVRDVSGYGANGTITGAIWVNVDGRRCLRFDGIDDHSDFGDPPDGHLDFGTGSFSFGCWYNPTSIVANTYIMDKTSGTGYSIYINNGNGAVAAYTNWASYDLTSIGTIGTGTWSLLYVTVDQSNYPSQGTIRTYNNGIQISTSVSFGSSSNSNAGNLFFGRYVGGGYSNGYLDEVRIYNRALSNAEVAQIYNATNGNL